MRLTKVVTSLILCAPVYMVAAQNIDAMRGDHAISDTPQAPRMEQVENEDIRRKRNYPMQPPTIPHKIDGYQVDINSNKCMSCHSRRRTEDTQAPMVSVTHYMDRDGNFLAEVSPRRYFCSQCHVPQIKGDPIISNTFEDIDDIIARSKEAE